MSGGPNARDPEEIREHRVEELERRESRETGYRRAFRVAMVVSLAAHLAVLFLLGRQLEMPGPDYDEAVRPEPSPTPGLRITRVRVQEPEEARPVPTPPRPVRPEPEPEEPEETAEEEEAADEEADEAPAGEEAAEERRISNVEALTPREGDPRLWREFWDEEVARRYLGQGTRADSALRAILGTYLDSLRLSEEQLRQARDWTWTDEDGERWGISPEGIHLGDVTIPLPVGQLLQPTGPKRRELEQELRDLRAIRRQEAIEEAQQTREERIEAMEERAREEQEGSPGDTTGSGGGRP